MDRRDFLRLTAMSAATAAFPMRAKAQTPMEKPNLILIIADQRTFGLSKATGFPLDTSPIPSNACSKPQFSDETPAFCDPK